TISSAKAQEASGGGSGGRGGGGIIDAVAKFGAKADKKTDLKACALTSPAKIVIPKGIYFLSTATLDGPCKAPIELQVEGTMKAPADLGAFNEPKWVAFNRIENFKLSGRRVFDGQGTTTYKREGCEKHDYCDSLPIFHVNVLGCKKLLSNISPYQHLEKAQTQMEFTSGDQIGSMFLTRR
ncbi:hypothetical protein Gotur_001043, partial [Gossypium turneri]